MNNQMLMLTCAEKIKGSENLELLGIKPGSLDILLPEAYPLSYNMKGIPALHNPLISYAS